MKKITLNVEGITQKQWTNFVLELNIMKKAWRPYGVDVKMLGPGIKKIYQDKEGFFMFGMSPASLKGSK